MTIVTTAHTTVEGTIDAQNDRGVKVDGTWLNLSKYRPIELPNTGARIRAEVDARGYLCSLEVLENSQSIGDRLKSDPPNCNSRDDRITRLAVLKAAAEFVGLWGQTREDVKSEHVLVLADKWLAWVREGD